MHHNSVMIKSNRYGLEVILDDKIPYEQLLADVEQKFRESGNFFKNATMTLTFQGRVLTIPQERAILDAIVEHSGVHIACIIDESKEHEMKCRQILEESIAGQNEKDGQFYKGTLRAGQVLESDTSIVILGDVNPGAQVISKGNIVVLGSCRGNIYAGATGNRNCFVAALVMKPLQVRIADKMARSAITKRVDTGEYAIEPKIAYIRGDHIYVKAISQETLADMEMGEDTQDN